MTDAQGKLEAIEREIGYRKRVYGRLVEQGKMKPATAASQIAIFEEIAADFREKVAGERLL